MMTGGEYSPSNCVALEITRDCGQYSTRRTASSSMDPNRHSQEDDVEGGKNRGRACSLPMPKTRVLTMSNRSSIRSTFWPAIDQYRHRHPDQHRAISKHASLDTMGGQDTASSGETSNNGAMVFDDVQPLDGCTQGGWSTFTQWSIESIRSWGKDTLPFLTIPLNPNCNHASAIGNSNSTGLHQLTSAGSFRDKRLSIKRMKHSRLVQKNGDCNVSHMNVPKKERQYIRDIFTTLIDVKWRYILFVFASGFLSSWTFFACIYYLVCFLHGDFENSHNATWPACVKNVNDMTSVFLFSVESQHTIGYGNRYTTTNCSAAITTLCVQSICGLLIQSFMAGLVFAKLARPKKRAETLIFSKNACISLRDNQLCFLFRVGDMRNTHLVESHIRLQMIKKRSTEEGEVLPLHQFDMDVGYDNGLDRIFLVWPITICHVIDSSSPLYEYAADDLTTAQFEIIVILEGIVESTGMTAQARTSYLPSEVMWGHRFEKLITFQKQNGAYQIDYSRFHKTFAANTPRVSAKELDAIKASGAHLGPQYYQRSLDDGCDSDSYTPSYTRASSFGPEDELGSQPARIVPVPSNKEACYVMNNNNSTNVKSIDEQKRTLLSPSTARNSSSLGSKYRKSSSHWASTSPERDSVDSDVDGGANHLANGGAGLTNRYASKGSVTRGKVDPPEIVVVGPSSPTSTADRPPSVLREHDIM